MHRDITLYFAPDNASTILRLALAFADVEYKAVLLDRSRKEQKSSEYLALNPTGLIPLLIIDGQKVFETGAGLVVLAQHYPIINSAPNVEESQSWLWWIANDLHALERIIFYAERYIDGQAEPLRLGIRKRLHAQLDFLEVNAPKWLLTGTGMHQAYLSMLLRWPQLYGSHEDIPYNLNDWPRLFKFAQQFEKNPVVRQVVALEGLGAKPFSQPEYANPPEGSAI